LNGEYSVELLSFSNPAKRPSKPEAFSLRHMAFEVNNIEQTRNF
jgi:glyoxylase I family protein